MQAIKTVSLLGAWFFIGIACNAANNPTDGAQTGQAGAANATNTVPVAPAIGSIGGAAGSSNATGNTATVDGAGGVLANAGNIAQGGAPITGTPTSSLASGATPGGKDCRDDWPEYPWKKQAATECTKCWTCKGEGFLPGMAFVACKVGDQCFRYATDNNCDYENFPRGGGLLPVHDPNNYCRKDYKNYTFFDCHVNGQRYIFETVDAEHYSNFADDQANIVNQVASNLPIPGGCAIKSSN